MARIPIYQERQQVQQQLTTPDLRAPDAGAGAIGRGLQQVGQGLQNLAVGQLRLDTENGKAQAAKIFGETQNEFVTLLQSEKENAPAGAKDFTGNFTTKLKDYRDKVLATQTDPFAKKFLESSINQLGITLSRDALMFEATEGRRQRIDDVKTSIDNIATSITKQPDPSLVKQSFGTIQAQIDSMQATPEEKRRLTEYNQLQLARAYVGTTAINNPRALVGMAGNRADGTKLSPSNVRDSTIDFIMTELEGSGYVENDAGAGPARHGVVEKYNPGFNAKSGTRDQAKQIYQGIWDSVDAGSLPPKLAAVMMDSAVNMGASKAKELLRQSGGSIEVFMQLRQDHYDRLVREDKEKYGQYEQGWKNRQDKLRSFLNTASDTEVATTDLTKSPQNNPASENIIDWLPLNEQLSYVKQAQTVIKQDQSAEAARFKQSINNSNAMAVDGIVDPKPLTQQDFYRVFDRNEADSQYANYEKNQVLASDIASFKSTPTDQIALTVEQYRPKAGDDYQIQEKRYTAAAQAATRVIEMRKKDPVAYVANTDSEVARLQNNLMESYSKQTSPEVRAALTNEYVTASLAEQERLGVQAPKVLSDTQIDMLTRRIGAGNESSADIVASLEQQYGREYFPKVMSELMQKGKLPPAMMIIPDLDSPYDRELVSRISTMKRSDIEVGVASNDVRDVKLKVNENIAQFSVSAGPMSVGMSQQLGAYQDTMERIAIDRLRTGVDTNAGAAVEAANKILLGKYQFKDTLRMPASVDAGEVTGGLNIALNQNVLSMLSFDDVPPDLTRARNPTEALAEWKSDIRSRHMWLANGDTTKAMLWARGKNGEFYKVMKGGEQYGITFEDATVQGKMQGEQVREILKRGF